MSTNDEKYEYPLIEAWGRMQRSFAYFRDAQQRLAKDTSAPKDAVYHYGDGTGWCTWNDIRSVGTREQLRGILREMGYEAPEDCGAMVQIITIEVNFVFDRSGHDGDMDLEPLSGEEKIKEWVQQEVKEGNFVVLRSNEIEFLGTH